MNSYFSHDSNARNSEKLIRVRMELGAEGYGVYFMILERLREEKDYKSIKDYNVIAFDLRVKPDIVKQVVENYNLFEIEDECFYSESFLRRMELKDEKSKKRINAGRLGATKRWENGIENSNAIKNDSNAIAMPLVSDSNAMAMLQKNIASKVKESKVKESKVNDTDTLSLFDTFWNAYPRKESKSKAKDWFTKNKPNEELLKKMLESLEKFKQTLQWQDKTFIPHPITWLNQKRWEDEVDLSKVVEVPSWYGDYKKDLKTVSSKQDMSQEEIDKILEEAKKKI